MNIAGPEFFVVLVVVSVMLGVPIWAVIDMGRHDDDSWATVGLSRRTWILVVALSTLFMPFVGWILATIYLVRDRPRLSTADADPGLVG